MADAAAPAGGWPYRDRLPFVLPDFTRIAWTGAAAQAVWEPRLARIAAAWFDIQWLSVAAGVRRCALVRLDEAALLARASNWFERGLAVAPLGLESDARLSYRSTSAPYRPGERALVCAAVGRPDAVDAMRDAWARRDADAMGALLGYPACCRRFFDAVWTRAKCVDTTWAMAIGDGAAPDPARVDVTGPPGANVLLRWIGVRKVPHLPCGFGCAATQAFADRFDRVGRDAGHAQALDWIDEALSWPVEWSALHGIAELRTPILKATMRSDATAGRHVVRRAGHAYPREGAHGSGFPYTARSKPVPVSMPFQRGIDHPLPRADGSPDWRHRDNGFASRHGMDRLQAPIVALARRALAAQAAQVGNVLDLGCGNGVLLQKICEDRPGLTPFGIDVNEAAIAHAAQVHPAHAGNFVRGDLFDPACHALGRRYALALLMVGRLVEAPPEAAARLLAVLQAHCGMLLLYAYPDAGRGAFGDLVARAGLTLLPGAAAYGGLAAYPLAPRG